MPRGSLFDTKLAGAAKRDSPRLARLPEGSNECGHVFWISNPREFLLEFTRPDGGFDCLASVRSPVQGSGEHFGHPGFRERVCDSLGRHAARWWVGWGERHEGRQACVRQLSETPQSSLDWRSPGLKEGPRPIIDGRHGHAHLDFAELPEEVEVPEHERGPRKHRHGPLRTEENFQRMTRDSVFPLDELVRIRRGRNRNESSRDLPDFFCEHARGVSLHDDGGSPFRPVDLQESRDIAEEATMVASDVWIEGVVEPREWIRAKSLADYRLADPERVPRGGDEDTEQVVHGSRGRRRPF